MLTTMQKGNDHVVHQQSISQFTLSFILITITTSIVYDVDGVRGLNAEAAIGNIA